MTKKLVNFRVDSNLWENYQNYCKSIDITATDSIINHINSTLSHGKDCKDSCKDNNDNVKTECKDTDRQNKEIESIKTRLFNQQINIDNQIILLIQRIDKLTNNNDDLKQNNIDLINEIELIKENQDKLIEKVKKLREENSRTCDQLPESEAHEMLPDSGDLPEVDPPVKTINYSYLTIAQLKNELDQLGIKYRNKATKLELINLLS